MRNLYEDVQQRDPLRAAIVFPDDSQQHVSKKFAANLKGHMAKGEKS